MRPVHPTPSGTPLAIGVTLRSTRLARTLTIADVATATGLSTGFISRVERDETSPSVTTLVTLCQVLSLPVGTLFEDPENEKIALSDAPRINTGGSNAVERLLTPRSESRVQVLRSFLEPGASGGDELYAINCDVETVHVPSGALRVRLVGGTVELATGDTVTLAGREPHSRENSANTETEIIWTIVPAAWSGSS